MKSSTNLAILSILLLLITSSACSIRESRPIELSSPNATIKIILEELDNTLVLTQLFNGDTIIQKSTVGLKVDNTEIFKDFVIEKIKERNFEESWNPVLGKSKEVQNNYNEIQLQGFKSGDKPIRFGFVIRCYDEGFAYRYIIPEQEGKHSVSINAEVTALNFTNDFSLWAYNGENHNIGPVTWSESKDTSYRIPIVIRNSKNVYVGIHEAEIIRYAPFEIQKKDGDKSIGIKLMETTDTLPLKTSWRTFIVGTRPRHLVNSNLLANLNEPCKIEDTSWIKPGRAVWDWRVWGYKAADGFTYGLNTDSHLRFIDFAAENNIQYLLIDADWYGAEFDENSDPTTARKDVDIEKCMRYAKEKGVGVILYLNDVGAKKFGLERVLKQFADWGAAGVKYGFMKGNMEEKVRYTRKVVELCAKNRLMVNFHDGPVPPSGDDRTWPNLITKEFCHSQADAHRSYFPETIVTTTFVNMMAGPIDNCDGWFDFNNSISREKVFQEIPGTVAAEVAKLIVVYTGMNIMPDAPEEYLKKKDLFDCIRKMPSQFDSFEVIDGEIGEYIAVARQAGDDWFIGILTNREARMFDFFLGFLPENNVYEITVYEDAAGSHYLTDRESYGIRKTEGTRESNINIYLAPGGGTALYLKKIQ